MGSNSEPPEALPGQDARARSILRGRLPTLRQCSMIGNLLSPDFHGAPFEALQLQQPTEHPVQPALHNKR